MRHLDRRGVLAHVLSVLNDAGLNVEHMENQVFSGGEAAVASLDVGGSVSPELLDRVGAVENVLGVTATPFDGGG